MLVLVGYDYKERDRLDSKIMVTCRLTKMFEIDELKHLRAKFRAFAAIEYDPQAVPVIAWWLPQTSQLYAN